MCAVLLRSVAIDFQSPHSLWTKTNTEHYFTEMVNCSSNLSKVIENHVPSLDDLKIVIEKSLKENFLTAVVDVVKCPGTLFDF